MDNAMQQGNCSEGTAARSMPMFRNVAAAENAVLRRRESQQERQKRNHDRPAGVPKALRNPATSEQDYTENQWLFMRGVEEYKRTHNRLFPTLTEILMIAESLGWSRDNGTWPADREAQDVTLAAVA